MQEEAVLQFLKRLHFNQFSLESKEYHGHSVSKTWSLLFVVIVSYLKFKPDSVQIGSANRGNVVPVGTVSLGRWELLKKACPLTPVFSQALLQYHLTCSMAWSSISTWSWVVPQFPLPINWSKEMGIYLTWSWATIIKQGPSASPHTIPKVKGEFTP